MYHVYVRYSVHGKPGYFGSWQELMTDFETAHAAMLWVTYTFSAEADIWSNIEQIIIRKGKKK